jgi:hypothetical protein
MGIDTMPRQTVKGVVWSIDPLNSPRRAAVDEKPLLAMARRIATGGTREELMLRRSPRRAWHTARPGLDFAAPACAHKAVLGYQLCAVADCVTCRVDRQRA